MIDQRWHVIKARPTHAETLPGVIRLIKENYCWLGVVYLDHGSQAFRAEIFEMAARLARQVTSTPGQAPTLVQRLVRAPTSQHAALKQWKR